MSGATDPVIPRTPAIRSTTTSGDTQRQEQGIIARLYEKSQEARRETSTVVVFSKKKVVTYGFKVVAVPSSPSSLELRGSETLTKADMRRLSISAPHLLVAHMKSRTMRPAQLAFAAEVLGAASDAVAAEQAIRPLLEHPSPLVREGAVYGLAQVGSGTSKELLRQVARQDSSPGVREAATEALGD